MHADDCSLSSQMGKREHQLFETLVELDWYSPTREVFNHELPVYSTTITQNVIDQAGMALKMTAEEALLGPPEYGDAMGASLCQQTFREGGIKYFPISHSSSTKYQ